MLRRITAPESKQAFARLLTPTLVGANAYAGLCLENSSIKQAVREYVFLEYGPTQGLTLLLGPDGIAWLLGVR